MNLPNEHRLKNQVAVVTGGGRGIGRAIAQALAAAGARVAVLARSKDELAETVRLIEQAGGQGEAFPADVTSAAAVKTAFASVARSLGPVDVLVNNAGVVQPIGPFHENNMEEWWRGIEVNLHAPALCAHAVLPGMVERRRGRIITVSSSGGLMAKPYFGSYITSKTAINRWSECLALEYKPFGISVFAISPGTVRTSMSEFSLQSEEGKKWLPWFSKIFDQNMDVPPERQAQLVLELASGRRDVLSGRFLSIYDDLDMLAQRANEIEQQNLYALKLDKIPGAGSYPALGPVFEEGRRAMEKSGK